MDQSHANIGQQIARAAHTFEKMRTKRGRKWVAVLLNEKTVVIALHADLTAVEKTLALSPAGAVQVHEFHRQLFADAAAPFLQKIKTISGMDVREMRAEIEPTSGSVVQLLTTDTAGGDLSLPLFEPTGTGAPESRPPIPSKKPARQAGNKNRVFHPGTIARV